MKISDNELSSILDPLSPQPPFEALHHTAVGLVVMAHTVQDAMQQQAADLLSQRLSVRGRLPPSRGHGDHDVAQVQALARGASGKTQHVCTPVDPTIASI